MIKGRNDRQEGAVPHPPCKLACPISTNAREYIQLIAERKFDEALLSIRKQNPFPRACGRICTHPCESACKRGQVDEPIAIAALKRFASDGPWRDSIGRMRPENSGGGTVAIIGSGPAGLAAARDLALLGHKVTVFEALPVAGGMLRVGVPEYRLPKKVLQEEMEEILALGVEIKTKTGIGGQLPLPQLLEDGYDAVFLAIGAHRDRKLGVPGEGLDSVLSAVAFLKAVSENRAPALGKRVAVVGGGNTAIDSARSALRLGAEEVHVLYRRSSEEMPAAKEEIREADAEGVKFSYLTSPLEIVEVREKTQGGARPAVEVKCVRNVLGEPDATGRRKPEPAPGFGFNLQVDTVIVAIGQAPDMASIRKELGLREGTRTIPVDESCVIDTSRPGLFAGGDAVTGPATLIKAIAAGQRAATAIDRYLNRIVGPSEEPGSVSPREQIVSESVARKTAGFPRQEKPCLAVGDRIRGFQEVDQVFPADRAVSEALRCLHCQLGASIEQEKCVSCLNCVRVCPLGIPRIDKMGAVTINPVDCQACGICALECPVRAIHISLQSRDDLAREIRKAIADCTHSGPPVVGVFDLHGNYEPGHMARLLNEHPGIAPVPVFGLRRIDTIHILTAFEGGSRGVFLAACPPDRDPFPEATLRTKRKMNEARRVLKSLGIDENRLAVFDMPGQGLVSGEALQQFVDLRGI